jgi:SAM-dependent methyltransferase
MTNEYDKDGGAADEARQRRAMEITLAEYDSAPDLYWQGTRDHDVSQNISALLDAIEGEPPFAILDFGCGPGRDLMRFVELGHDPVGLDGAGEFAAMARDFSGCEVLHQNFITLDLPPARFDGVFANASLFHVPSKALPRVLGELNATLKPGGVLFSSNPRGNNQECMVQGRYGCFHDLAAWRGYVSAAGFAELSCYYRPPGRPRERQPWLATVWRKL